jgi:DNA modification methylase
MYVGFYLKDDRLGWANIYCYYYEKLEESDYLKCLDEIYEIYIKPYFDLQIDLLNIIAKDPTCKGNYGASKKNPYLLHPHAVEKIWKMK